ncbi:LacI family DNA-binding transcriptional regulator [Bifidobacterium sp. ESL0732]|uniref:LacI family DNA-binding transcriptional regulator n=1 Tax=Bifidobacterium sp. ESL0732 TaxID=2983222 RepID=UPI0023F9199C|nr:LacI family DNA-binding transcriptional regulator [Bifidobacterium sp. ESL0732]WEV64397.1 LacI family DNA-binding transcriptional regulator [Bifidobacterium sp. ESL0732]
MNEVSHENAKKTPSINDVAKLAGVSVSSVSRYLNNAAHLRDEKKHRIAQAIEMLDYHPSLLARGLAANRSKTIALFTGSKLLYGVTGCIQGIEAAASKAGAVVDVVLLDKHQEPGKMRQTIKSTLSVNPCGVIIDQPRYDTGSEMVLREVKKDVPLVLIGGNRIEGQCQLFTYDDHGGYRITQHLLSLGHKTVFHVAVPEEDESQTRQSGWRRALEEAGAVVPPLYRTSWDPLDAVEVGRKLGQRDDVTAVFAGNDEIALGVIRGLYSVGKRVPQDVSVAGFDNNPIASLSIPSLTTWRQDFEHIGIFATDLILDQIAGNLDTELKTAHYVGDTAEQLIIRESTAAPPAQSR